MSKISAATKERIRNLIFLIFGGLGTLAGTPAVLVAWSEYAAASTGTSLRFPPDKIAIYRNDLILSLVILGLFVFILIYPAIRKKTGSWLSATLPPVGLIGICCFVRIAIEVTEVVKYNLSSDPELNIIRTYGVAILATTVPLAFFSVLFGYYSYRIVKSILQARRGVGLNKWSFSAISYAEFFTGQQCSSRGIFSAARRAAGSCAPPCAESRDRSGACRRSDTRRGRGR